MGRVLGVISTLCAAAVVAGGATAVAGEKTEHGHHNKPAAYVFKGTFNADGTVAVEHGNKRVRRGGFVGTAVAFDYSQTKIRVADTDGDTFSSLADVQTGDKVLVLAKLGRRDPGSQPFRAKSLLDKSNPPPDDAD